MNYILPLHYLSEDWKPQEYIEIDTSQQALNPNTVAVIDTIRDAFIKASSEYHNIINKLTAIIWDIDMFLDYNYDENIGIALDNLDKEILRWEIPDFWYFLWLILKYRWREIEKDEKFIELVNQIRFLEKRLMSKKLEYKDEYFSYNSIKSEVLKSISSEKQISFESRIENWYYINFRLYSNLWNKFNLKPILVELIADLLDNSIKYSDIWTQIDVVVTQTREWITVSVSDEWYWIKEKEIDKVFKYKERLNNSEGKRGSGIWWFKLKKVVSELWWKLFFKSKPWVWTEILFRVPSSLDPVVE